MIVKHYHMKKGEYHHTEQKKSNKLFNIITYYLQYTLKKELLLNPYIL